jgi:hypothetical protein
MLSVVMINPFIEGFHELTVANALGRGKQTYS